MFKSKFAIFVIVILIICLLAVVFLSSFNNIETNSTINETNDGEGTILIQDENWEIHKASVTHTHSEGSASDSG